MADKPNILFVMTDQHRGDALGADPHCPTDSDGRSLVHTPNIDNFVEDGALFSSAYSPAPTCVPARRCLWTGQTPASCDGTYYHGREWDFENSLPHMLRDAGYQTLLSGKTHSSPYRNHFGFEDMEIHAALDSPRPRGPGFYDDYMEWLDRRSNGEYDENSHGLNRNSWDPRPWNRPEHEHPTNWTTNRALEHLEKRDPTRPFFLTVSYVRPHQPFDPPQRYWDMYADQELPKPVIGDWAEERFRDLVPEHPNPDAWLADLPPTIVHRARAAYYGLITHIDHQLSRILTQLSHMNELENTLIIFTSDHGDMLGDHLHWRKTYPYEGSARIPMLIQYPSSMADEYETGQFIDRPVGIEDIMPTVLDAAHISCPDTVEGRNLFDLIGSPDREDWRRWYHGEHGPTFHESTACQYIVGEFKYMWNPITGDELLFDLEHDPNELTNLSDDPDYEAELSRLRNVLGTRLAGRPEGFSNGEELQTVTHEAWS